MKRFLPIIIIFAVAAIAVSAGTVLYRSKREAVSAPIAAELTAENAGIKSAHIRGDVKAPVVLEEFADLQCPPCAALSVLLKKVEHEHAGRVQVIFRQFPLAMHQHALEAARATEAAGVQGRFWEMSDLLYEMQTTWSQSADVRELFEGYASKIGLNLEKYKADLGNEALHARIDSDKQRGTSLSVTATPTLFVNNQRVPLQSMSEPGLRAAIAAALEGKQPFPVQ